MFSKTCEYAIRAVIFIAQRSKNGDRVGIKEIASGIDSPEHFIAKILQELGKHGLVQSVKGPSGGFYLDAATAKYSIADIVKAVDGEKIFAGCGLGLKQCSETHPCPIHHEFKKIRKDIFNMLEKAKLGKFNEQLEKQLAFLKR
jgi:Rrf2 family protein